ncbi:MAG: hypothetical protein DMF11_05940 [Verrucomicrobia bacterium]|nr:MAG: hypothetical protein DMF11_05940 [Verrucomicrobiota bacterium]
MGLLLPAQRFRSNPSRKPVSLSTRDSKVPKPRQICNLNDHGTASFQQKASATLTAATVVSKRFSPCAELWRALSSAHLIQSVPEQIR